MAETLKENKTVPGTVIHIELFDNDLPNISCCPISKTVPGTVFTFSFYFDAARRKTVEFIASSATSSVGSNTGDDPRG
jgi:hypothetical protein